MLGKLNGSFNDGCIYVKSSWFLISSYEGACRIEDRPGEIGC